MRIFRRGSLGNIEYPSVNILTRIGCWFIGFFLLLSCPVAGAAMVAISGVVLDETTNGPVPNVEISLYELTVGWKFWNLPGRKLIDSEVTDGIGRFSLSGEVSGDYFVEFINFKECWAPAKLMFEEGRENIIKELKVLTAPQGKCR